MSTLLRNRMPQWTLGIVINVLALFVITGCGAVNNAESEVIVPIAAVKQIDTTLDELIDVGENSLTFRADSSAAQTEVGELLVSSSPDAPLLRRVVNAFTAGDGTVTLVTEPIAISEAFTIISAKVPATFLSFEPAPGVTVVSEAVATRAIPGAGGLSSKEVSIIDLDLQTKVSEGDAEVQAGVKLSMSAILEVDASIFTGLERLKASLTSDYAFDLGMSLKQEGFLNKSVPLGKATVVFWFGPIPVWSRYDLSLDISADLSAAVSATLTGSAVLGSEWTADGGWRDLHEFRSNGGEIKAEGQISAQALATVKWTALETLGATLAFGPSLTVSVDFTEPCDLPYELDAKATATMGFAGALADAVLRDSESDSSGEAASEENTLDFFSNESTVKIVDGAFKICEPTPAQPTNLVAGAADERPPVTLAWTDQSDDESGFLVQWNAGQSWSSLAILGANVTAFTHENPTVGETNSYQVFAIGSEGTLSEPSTVASVSIRELSPPAAPSDLTAAATEDGTVVLVWTNHADDADGFMIERTGGEGGAVRFRVAGADISSQVDVTVEPEQTYSYQVQAFNAAGASSFSNSADVEIKLLSVTSGPPAAPSGLGANQSDDTTVVLSWQDNSQQETSFEIQRSPEGGGWQTIGGASENAIGFVDTISASTTVFFYRVRAVNDEGNSAYSNVASTNDETTSSLNDELCEVSELCCAGDDICDSSWFACPEEDTDCSRCGESDGHCIESCLEEDPDCPSRSLICGAIGVCCAGDGVCDVQCPLSDLDPDCTNDAYCAQTGLCCDDGICHEFCNSADSDCQTADGGSGGGTNGDAGTGTDPNENDPGNSSGCSTIRWSSDLRTDPYRLVTPDVELVAMDFHDQTDRIPICDSQTVQVFDLSGALLAEFFVPFSLVDVPLDETPLVFTRVGGIGAEPGDVYVSMEYLTLEAVSLFP